LRRHAALVRAVGAIPKARVFYQAWGARPSRFLAVGGGHAADVRGAAALAALDKVSRGIPSKVRIIAEVPVGHSNLVADLRLSATQSRVLAFAGIAKGTAVKNKTVLCANRLNSRILGARLGRAATPISVAGSRTKTRKVRGNEVHQSAIGSVNLPT